MMIHKDFTTLNLDELKLVLQWRNHKNISQFMLNKSIEFKEHLNFIERLKKDKNKKYFLLYKAKEAFGVIYFTKITKTSCEFGLYAKPNLKGVGQILMDEIKKYAFENLRVKNLKACVFKDNEKALKLYKNNDFIIAKEDEKFFYITLNNPDCKTLSG